MFDHSVITMFHNLRGSYTRASAGLFEDLCFELRRVADKTPSDLTAMLTLTEILSECFRPMDADAFPECDAWDQAYSIFGGWLWRDNSSLHNAVREITGWPDNKLDKCKLVYLDWVRANRDQWQRAVDQVEAVN